MKSISQITPLAWSLFLVALALDACSGGALPTNAPLAMRSPAQTPARAHRRDRRVKLTGGYVYVSNRTAQGASEVLVYKEGVQNPSPTLTITKDLVDVAGVAVDSSGNLYVANGSGRNVLEYAPGGTSLLETYSTGLINPVGVTVANGTLYVSDQGNASNGYIQQIFEYTPGNGTPTIAIGGIGAAPSQLNEQVAVNPTDKAGAFYESASTLGAVPPTNNCLADSGYTLAKNVLPTLWVDVPLSHNQQASGLAFDPRGNMYVADVCANDVAIYAYENYAWTYTGDVAGTFDAPFFLTIANDFLAVPSSGSGSTPGFVTIIDLAGQASTVTIKEKLNRPIGAAVGSI